MGKKLLEKSLLVTGIRSTPTAAPSTSDQTAKPKTAPGTMLQFIGQQSEAIKELEGLRAQAKSFEGSRPVRRIDAKLIRASQWANRHVDSFSSPEFVAFADEIESAGGNVQPIKVRQLAPIGEFQYEIVFGHRRHRACLERGFPVLAEIDQLDDQELFVEMDRENRKRADLRPYEQGLMYARALDKGLFSSARKLAQKASIDPTNLGKALSLARLPDYVISAFQSPLDLQYRWASDLTQAIQKDPDVVLSIAKSIKIELPRPASAEVFKRLTGGSSTVLLPPSEKIVLKGKRGQSGSISLNSKARSVAITLSNINPQRFEAIQTAIQTLIS